MSHANSVRRDVITPFQRPRNGLSPAVFAATTVTFAHDFPEVSPPATPPYREAGLEFCNNHGNQWHKLETNGFVWIAAAASKMIIRPRQTSTFSPVSMLICNIDPASPPQSITFTGYRLDGSTLTAWFVTPSGNKRTQTCELDGFTDLVWMMVDLPAIAFTALSFVA